VINYCCTIVTFVLFQDDTVCSSNMCDNMTKQWKLQYKTSQVGGQVTICARGQVTTQQHPMTSTQSILLWQAYTINSIGEVQR